MLGELHMLTLWEILVLVGAVVAIPAVIIILWDTHLRRRKF